MKQYGQSNVRALVFKGVISLEKTLKWLEPQFTSGPSTTRISAVSQKEKTIAVTGKGVACRAPAPAPRPTLGGSLTVQLSPIRRRSRRLTA